jgi:chromosome segregation ATPase
MADRISALETERAALESRLMSTGPDKANTAHPSVTPSNDPGVAQLRLELAEALRSRGVAETRLRTAEEELDKLRAKTKGDARSIRDLSAELTAQTTRLKDREYELREKRKLLEVLLTYFQSTDLTTNK